MDTLYKLELELSELIQKNRPDYLIKECRADIANLIKTDTLLITSLESYGYQVHDVDGKTFIVDPMDDQDGFCLVGNFAIETMIEAHMSLELCEPDYSANNTSSVIPYRDW